MAKSRKRKPYDPSKAMQLDTIVVDDPYEFGAKLTAIRSIRNDPLAGLHSRRFIDDAQYHAGRAFQRDFETAERGPGAIDPSKEAVDGGQMPEPITEAQRKAAKQLAVIYKRLGQSGSALLHDVLIHGRTMEQIGVSRMMGSEAELKYIGRRFRECLDELAVIYDLAMPVHRTLAMRRGLDRSGEPVQIHIIK